MNWREAYDILKQAVEACPQVVANGLPVLDGVQAVMAIDKLAETFEGTFQDNPFTVVIEHPAATAYIEGESANYLKDAWTILVVENPRQRETTALDPLIIPHAIAASVIGQPNAYGGHNFTPNQEFYRYQGDARGFLFHRFTFLITTEMPGTGLPIGPAPVDIL